MKKYLPLFVILICCFSCNEKHPSEPDNRTPYEKWKSFNFHNYTIDQNRSCFCPYGGQTVRITVNADTISTVINLNDSSFVNYPFYRTIDSLFGIISNSISDSLVVRYNAEFGYPEYLDVNPQLHPIDGGYLYETSNLRIP